MLFEDCEDLFKYERSMKVPEARGSYRQERAAIHKLAYRVMIPLVPDSVKNPIYLSAIVSNQCYKEGMTRYRMGQRALMTSVSC